ncbi:hypothetical protein SD70_13705 [Gordoniibacillus kamchatkensis]|uniref:Homeodomain phBC6A51-type domain-containing protein n=1 Tax=Gordoniibacillus kamchatkensis TaxID=1590651 RepID=A0ABR5AHD6_9BACL|nr:phBC6A51 family helix-turn-helix protein [Paenibacillus sp. VKM B-2647]KIL40454.1 hypothetical protein SD70_13705 [Paenibacillus sp. VKM B-2647]
MTHFNETDQRVIEELSNQNGRTFEQIAEAVGISVRQLHRIRQKPAVKAELKRLSNENSSEVVILAMPDIVRALTKKAKNGDVKAAQLLFQMQGLLIDRKEITATTQTAPSSYEDMSKDEIAARMAEIQRQLDARPKRIEIALPSPHSNKDYGLN